MNEEEFITCPDCKKFVRRWQTEVRDAHYWCQCQSSQAQSLNQEAVERILDNLIERIDAIERFLQL